MIFDQNIVSLYGPFHAGLGLGFGWTELSGAAAVVEVTIQMICAGIVLTPRISANLSMQPRLDAEPSIEQC